VTGIRRQEYRSSGSEVGGRGVEADRKQNSSLLFDRRLAVPVEVVAVPKGAVWGRRAELRVDHLEAVDDHPVVGGRDPKANQFEEAGVSHLALVDDTRTAVPEVVGGAGVGVTRPSSGTGSTATGLEGPFWVTIHFPSCDCQESAGAITFTIIGRWMVRGRKRRDRRRPVPPPHGRAQRTFHPIG
jgi:hypothetical protein